MFREGDEIVKCPSCGSKDIRQDIYTGEVCCAFCGLVVSELSIDMGPEWRKFAPEDGDRSRTGPPTSLVNQGLSTVIGKNRDARGGALSVEMRMQVKRMARWHQRSKVNSGVERNLARAIKELERLSDLLHIPESAKLEAIHIYRRALDKGLVKGRSINVIAAASLYTSCRLNLIPRSMKKLARMTPIPKKDLARSYRLILKELNLRMPVPSPGIRISKIAEAVGISHRSQLVAIEILRKAEQLKLTSGKDPTGLAAAALYLACILNREKFTQKSLAEVAEVTEVTIRNRYKNLRSQIDIDALRVREARP